MMVDSVSYVLSQLCVLPFNEKNRTALSADDDLATTGMGPKNDCMESQSEDTTQDVKLFLGQFVGSQANAT